MDTIGAATMNSTHMFKLFTAVTFLFASQLTFAQSKIEDEASVWSTVEAQWTAIGKQDKKWPDQLLADNFSGWGTNSPAPRNKESVKMWNRFNSDLGKMIAHELYPLSIIVNGDVAVAHYLYSSISESKKGDIERNNGRYTDILIRTGDGWKFLAWHGGDE